MSKTIYLICNAHIDPVWQWEWEEGAAEALSTFRVAARLCEEFDGFVFNHNEALLYRWIEEFEPALFARIQRLVKEGKWHIMGGWHLQPDCNMPSGEGFVRQIAAGRAYFLEKFGVAPTTAINFDPFGHTRGLVQIMKKCGYDSYLFMRPDPNWLTLPADLFRWVGYDGSTLMAQRTDGYGSALGRATEKIKGNIDGICPEDGFSVCLWGVGDHGGGPSKADLEAITALQKEMEGRHIHVLHSTPEEYFRAVKESGCELPEFADELNSWAPGCYTSMIRVKQQYRALENMLFTTERMATAAELAGKMEWPAKELGEAAYDLLTVQFHDMLPGSSIQPSEDMALRMLDHGREILSRVRARAFFALSGGQPAPMPDKIPIMIYNPHPFPVEGDFTCEMMLWDQNWAPEYSMPQVVENGRELPTQNEKEHSSLNLDWRKRVVFHATLQPMQMNRFDCRYDKVPAKPTPHAEEDGDYFYLRNAHVTARVSKATGYLDAYAVNGREFLNGRPCVLHIVKDNCDPWGMTVGSFPDRIDTFRLLSPEEGSRFSGVHEVIPSVRCVESGAVRTVIEAVLGYGRSRAVMRYTLSHTAQELAVDIRLEWAEVQTMVKFGIPAALDEAACFGQVAYGVQKFPQNGRENCAHNYLMLKNREAALGVCTDSVYGSGCEDSTLYMTLLRSPAYCAHPIGDREIIPQDRFTPHMEQGERTFRFLLLGGTAEAVDTALPRLAATMNEPPFALSFYPPQGGERPLPPVTVSGDAVDVPALKKAADGNGYILRLFDPFDRAAHLTVSSVPLGIETDVTLQPYEIKTLRLTAGTVQETDLLEHPVK